MTTLQVNVPADGPSDPPDVDTLQALSRRVLAASLTILAIAMPLISAVMVSTALYSGTLTASIFATASSMIVFPVLRLFSRRLGFTRSAVLLVILLALSALLIATRGGLTPGYAALCVLTVQLSALFFRRRGAALGLAAVVAVHFVAWMLVTTQLGPPLTPEMWDPLNNAIWIRQLVVLGLLGLVIALGQLYVIEQLADSLARHRALAEREKSQRLALEEAERLQAHEREQRAQAQQALERSRRTEALARVAGSVAHDFNNSLTVILGAAEAAKEDSRSPNDVEMHMDGIIEAARHAAALTHQLLTLGRQRLSTPVTLSAAALLARIRPAFGRVLPADVLLTVDMPTDDVPIRVDETGMDRALLNLVLNARDAMPRGGTITISCRRELVPAGDSRLTAGPHLALQVTDDGVGMDQETLERVFDPFFTTKGDKGTGLGLASVYAFATESGGTIDVASTPGTGTTFTMWIPEAPAGEATRAANNGGTTNERSFTERILVVEDLDEVRAVMTRVLGLRGFEVVEARSGDEALDAIEQGRQFALMCIDGVMPGRSTAATIERARELNPQLRVIVCSGHVQEDLLRRGIETGRYELLPKPFTSQELVARISRALEQPAARAQSQEEAR